MANLGSLVAKISADTSNFQEGMKKSSDDVAQFDKSTEAKFKKIEDAIARMGDKAKGFNFVNLAAGISVFQTATGWVRSAASAVIGFFDTGIESIAMTTNLSRSLGTTTESIIAFRLAVERTGGDAKNADAGFMSLQQALGMIDAGSAAAGESFRLLGLDGKKLSAMNLDDAMHQVANSIKAIEDPSKKASAATAVFGDNARNLLAALNQGGGAFDSAAQASKRLGTSYSQLDGSGVQNVQAQWKEMASVWDGIKIQIATQLIPIIQAALEGIKSWGGGSRSVGEIVSSVMEAIATGCAHAYVAILKVKRAFALMSAASQKSDQMNPIMFGSNLAKGVDIFNGSNEEIQKQMEANAKQTEDAFNSSVGAVEELDDEIANAIPRVKEFFANMNKGAKEAAERFNDVAKAGKSVEDANKHGNQFVEKGKEIFNATRTPLEKYREQIDQLQAAFKGGGLTADTYARGLDQAMKTLETATIGPVKLTGAVEANSQAAQSSISQFSANQDQAEKRSDPATRLAQLQEQSLETQRRSLNEIQRLNDFLQRNAGVQVRF